MLIPTQCLYRPRKNDVPVFCKYFCQKIDLHIKQPPIRTKKGKLIGDFNKLLRRKLNHKFFLQNPNDQKFCNNNFGKNLLILVDKNMHFS